MRRTSRTPAMTGSRRLSATLIASGLAACLVLPLSAAELSVPAARKAASVSALAPRPARPHLAPHLIRVASAACLPSSGAGSPWAFRLILGTAY